MFTTVRAVFANENYKLSKEIIDTIFTVGPEGSMYFGDALLASKNSSQTNAANHRKFTLLGDPSQQIALPTYSIETIEINEKVISNTTNHNTIFILSISTLK